MAKRNFPPLNKSIIRSSIIIGIEEFFEPLKKLKVVLELSFRQSINRNDLKKKFKESKFLIKRFYLFYA